MSIDIQREHAITLSEVPQHVPVRAGKKVHYSTVYRWVTKGVRGRILESAMVGGIRFTTVEAVQRFFAIRPTTNTKSEPTANWSEAIEQSLRRDGV